MSMTNLGIVRNFLHKRNAQSQLRDIPNGYYTYKGRTLYTQGNGDKFSLINYQTEIAYIKNDIVYLNVQKYSVTTTKIQNTIAYQASLYNMPLVRYCEK